MSIIGWIILGLIAGFIGSKIVNREGQGFWLDIALGIIGALVGGYLFAFFGCLLQTERQTQGGREERVSTVFRCRPEQPSGLHPRTLPSSTSYWLRVRFSFARSRATGR